jgi:hypothetical protein
MKEIRRVRLNNTAQLMVDDKKKINSRDSK